MDVYRCTLIFLDRHLAHASCDRLRRLGSEPDGSASPSTFALRFLLEAGGAGGVEGAGKDGGWLWTEAISGW